MKNVRFLKTLSTALVVVAMVFAFLIAGIRIFGVQVYGVLTGSMEPSYPTGSLIYVKRVDASDLRVNDVITFSISPDVIATHRIVEVVPDETNPSIVRYRTKGDANKDVDASLVSAGNIIGKVMFSIPQMGYIASYIQQPPGIYVAILVCGLLIAFVFYTDSLENKQKESFRRGSKRGYASQKRPRQDEYSREDEYSRRREYDREDGYSRQRGYSREDEYPRRRESSRQDEYARQREYSREDEYPRRRESSRQDEYARQREYSREDEYPRRRESSRQDEYARQRSYSREDEYPRRRESSRQDEYARQYEYPRRRTYSQSGEDSYSRESRTGKR